MNDQRIVVSLNLKRTINIMKLTVLMLAVCLSQVVAATYAQTARLNVSAKNETLESVLKQIEKQSEFLFFYNLEEVNKNEKISINKKNADIQDVLDAIATKTGLKYAIKDRHIVLTSNDTHAVNTVQQDRKIKGKIVDMNNEPVIGANVVIKGTTNGTVTDIEGYFEIDAPLNAEMLISYIGYLPQAVKIGKNTSYTIQLKEDTQALDEVVVVGYGTQKKATLTGAVASIKGEEIVKVSQPSIRASMLGKVPGIRFQQTNGEPGNDGGTFDIRGFGDALTIVDGVERPFSQIDPNEIESINILKDASASVYGFKGANGVIIIETKKGNISKPKINYSYTIGLQNPVKNLEMMDAYQYAYYRNEALMNAGQAPKYTAEELEKYRTGSDPVNYPTTDWYKEAVRKVSPKQQHNLNINGGSEKIRYFFSLGYLNQEGILKSSQEFDRYNFRSNIVADITPKLKAEVGLGGRLEDYKYPYYLGDEGVKVFSAIKSNAPNVPVYANNNPAYYYNSDNNELNPIAMLDREATGYKDKRYLEFNGQMSLSYEIMKGFIARAFLAYDYTSEMKKELKKDFKSYTYDQTLDVYNPITKVAQGELYQRTQPYYKTTQQYSLSYKNTFGKKHNVEGLLLFEWKEVKTNWFDARRYFSMTSAIPELDKGDKDNMQNSGNSSVDKYGGYVGRFNYDFAGKYMAEFSFRYDGSFKNSPNHRWGFFPAVSAGWRLSEEPFIKDAVPAMDNFKIRGSWGKIGNNNSLNANNFVSGWLYPSGNYIFGGNNGASITQGLSEANLANMNIFWYKVQTTNIGFDGSFWNGKLSFEFDYFYRKTTGLYATRETSLPTTAGIPLPQENLNSSDNRGFELTLGTAQRIGNVDFRIKGNVAYSRAKDLYKEQAAPLNQYKNWRDNGSFRYTNKTWGYEAIGQFQSYEEIYKSPIQDGKANSSLRPGDIKYQDLNGDGIIDDNDQKVIGKGAFPDLNFGLNLTFAWNNFDLDILFQGASNYTQMLNACKNPFRGPGEGNGFEIWTDRWHKADYDDPYSEWVPGKFPSLRIDNNDNNSRSSTYWTTNAYYVRMKSIELGYSIPKSLLSKVGVDNLRVYFNAYNPLTITNVKYTDPEAVEGWMSFYYPQLKVYSFGINIGF